MNWSKLKKSFNKIIKPPTSSCVAFIQAHKNTGTTGIQMAVCTSEVFFSSNMCFETLGVKLNIF